ncbi:4-hydroxyphenylpyruvate dioxygenase [Zychaea mexicana]|uniref:4-hydroxyphenylpyruvate dioxygenase n=1 Tax=Zychaea mexicana TaxID=64656 RepID=UPI0022FDBFBF|nr:4-hydroxyphenylpyruvate dioxygenase [Zychaea mexicana]KAI9490868.1 4-hydroxyphenylpyruvate dioxygenase [Zychaea mexicana]
MTVEYPQANGASQPSRFSGYDHLRFTVTNAKQAASYYCTRFGFKHVAYCGLETGSRDMAAHVVRCGNATLVFECPLQPGATPEYVQDIIKRGDGVKDVAFTVNDCRKVYEQAIARGAKSIRAPEVLEDENGRVVISTIATYGDVYHTLVERHKYRGVFLPGYQDPATSLRYVDPLDDILPPVPLGYIDHVVGSQPENMMLDATDYYEKVLGFHRFWSVDDKDICTEYSAMRSIVMTDPSQKIMVPINEPASGKKKSSIQEFVDFYGGAGVQHIAIHTNDIISAVSNLRKRGCGFLRVPDTYYTALRTAIAKHNKTANQPIDEDLDALQKQNILIDYDENGYLMQIFTRPVEDRPTLFFEVIQRRNFDGFGAGNFKSLFEALEKEQASRGNLTNMVVADEPMNTAA